MRLDYITLPELQTVIYYFVNEFNVIVTTEYIIFS